MARITQADLAQRLGVSQQAVSFALNNSGTLAEETRQRIVEEALRLGYRPNHAARSMLRGTTGNVALLGMEDFRSFIPTGLLGGVQTAVEERGQHLILQTLSKSRLEDPSYVPGVMKELAVDSAIISYEGPGVEKLREWIDFYSIPAIWTNDNAPQNCVYPDDEKLAFIGTEALIAKGHRNIIYVGPAAEYGAHFSTRYRIDGFRRAVAAGGAQGWVLSPDNQEPFADEVKKAVEEGATACFCYGERDATEAMVCALRRGLEVPRNLSISTMGMAMADIGRTKLNVLRIPFYWVGRKAVELLEERVRLDGADVPSFRVDRVQFDEGSTVREL